MEPVLSARVYSVTRHFHRESYICLPFIHARCSIVIIIYTDKAGGDLAVFPNGRGATNAFVLSVRVFLYLLLITVIGMGCLFSSFFALFIGWFLFVLCYKLPYLYVLWICVDYYVVF